MVTTGSLVAAPRVQCGLAEGGFTHILDRGRYVGADLSWEAERRQFRGVERYIPSEEQISSWSEEQLAQVWRTGWGAVYEAGLQAVILPWAIKYQGVEEEFWWGTAAERAQGSDERYSQRMGDAGRWRIVQPTGLGYTYLQQYDGAVSSFQLTSRHELGADPSFAVTMYREASPEPEEEPAGASALYTGFDFGGVWSVRLPKGWPAELYRLVGGKWKLCSFKTWKTSELYGDSYGCKEIYVIVMVLDGKLLIKSSFDEESWVYADPSGRAIAVAAAPVTLRGNAGPAYYGLHQVEYASSGWNVLLSRETTTLDKRPATAPTAIAVGSKPAATWARVYAATEEGEPLTEAQLVGERGRTLRLACALYSADGTRTPVLKAAGLLYPSVVAAGPQQYLDISADWQAVEGGYTFSIEERMATARWRITLDNSKSQYSDLAGNHLVRLLIGRPDADEQVTYQELCTCIAGLGSDDIEGYSEETAELIGLDRMEALGAMHVGDREPLDGLTVAEAIRRVLGWGYVRPAEIGTLYDSGRRLPSSSYALQRLLHTAGEVVSGSLDVESGAACKLRPELTIKAALQHLMHYDWATYCWWDRGGLFRYQQLSTAVARRFRETESAAAEDEIVGGVSSRPRLSEGYTSVEVQGRDRATGRPLCSRACDYEALGVAGRRFRGIDRTKPVSDQALNTKALVALRCRWEYEWARRTRDEKSFSALGQIVEPVSAVEISDRTGTRTWLITGTSEQATKTEWTLGIDAVAA